MSTSAWAAPMVIVRKKDGIARIFGDFRKLNQVNNLMFFPMPRIDDLMDTVEDTDYITTMNLAKGYLEVPTAKEDREKTDFTSPSGIYQFRVMPLGLSGAPTTFQRMIDNVLRGTKEFTGVYIDNVNISSRECTSHLQHIERVFEKFKEAGLTVKLKCIFAANECSYLQHLVGKGGIKPEESKSRLIKEMERPNTKNEVRSFLGMTGYYWRFIRNYAEKAEPLTTLTRKGVPEKIPWTTREEITFQHLKQALLSAEVMKNPDLSKTLILQTDAPGVGVGAVFS